MNIKETTELNFTEEELDILEKVTKARADYCTNHGTCNGCPFRRTFFCLVITDYIKVGSKVIRDNTRKIVVNVEQGE